MAVADNSILRVAAHFISAAASDIVNVYHFTMDSVGDVSEANVLADLEDLIDALMTNLDQAYPTSTSCDSVEAWVWNSTLSRWDSIGEVNGTWAGTSTNLDEAPAGVAMYVRADSSDAQAKGAKYLPPPNDAALADGLITSTVMTYLANFLTDYAATYVGTYAEFIPGLWQIATESFKLFSGTGTTSNVPAYQRRRKPGVGE
jgi:hypothetical protein